MSMNTFSLIIPVGREEGRIDMSREIAQLDYPDEWVETLFIGGTAPPGRKRNDGAARAKNSYLVFLDDDLELPRDLLHRLNDILVRYRIPIVGGSNIGFKEGGIMQRLTDIAFASPLGFGKGHVRFRNSGIPGPGNEDNLTACLLCVKRDVFLEAGGFDNYLYPGEEIEMIRRMKEKQLPMLFAPSLFVYHQRRSTLGALFKQIYRYGKSRIKVWRQRKFRRADLPYLLPLSFVLYLLLLPAVPWYFPWYVLPAVVYFTTVALTVIKAGFTHKLPLVNLPVLAVLFINLHLSYGTGLLVQLLTIRRHPGTQVAVGVPVRTQVYEADETFKTKNNQIN